MEAQMNSFPRKAVKNSYCHDWWYKIRSCDTKAFWAVLFNSLLLFCGCKNISIQKTKTGEKQRTVLQAPFSTRKETWSIQRKETRVWPRQNPQKLGRWWKQARRTIWSTGLFTNGLLHEEGLKMLMRLNSKRNLSADQRQPRSETNFLSTRPLFPNFIWVWWRQGIDFSKMHATQMGKKRVSSQELAQRFAYLNFSLENYSKKRSFRIQRDFARLVQKKKREKEGKQTQSCVYFLSDWCCGSEETDTWPRLVDRVMMGHGCRLHPWLFFGRTKKWNICVLAISNTWSQKYMYGFLTRMCRFVSLIHI